MKQLLSTATLTVTLAFAGVAFANESGHGKDWHEGPPPFMQEALSKLPAKDAATFRDTMKQSREKNQALHEQMHKLHDELHSIMTAKKFDKNAFIAKSNELEKLHDKMHASMTEAFATALSKLPADERKTLAEAMPDGHGDHRQRHESKKGDGDMSSPESGSDQ